MPTPVSSITIRPGCTRTVTLPASVYLQALRSRLPNSTANTRGGACRANAACSSSRSSTGLCATSARAFSISSWITSLTTKSSSGNPTSPSRAMIRKASTSDSISPTADWMRRIVRVECGAIASSASSTSPAMRITVIGVRSSWLASRVKLRSRCTKVSMRLANSCSDEASTRVSPCTSTGRFSALSAVASGRFGSHCCTWLASQMIGEIARCEDR